MRRPISGSATGKCDRVTDLVDSGGMGLAVSVLCAASIVFDIYGRGRRQRLAITNAVWPITALYLGPVAWIGSRRWGSVSSPAYRRATGTAPRHGERVSVALAVSHCGAGCTVGDMIGAWVAFAAGWNIAGLALPAEYIADVALAFGLGIVFQYLSIVQMRSVEVRVGLLAALKAGTPIRSMPGWSVAASRSRCSRRRPVRRVSS